MQVSADLPEGVVAGRVTEQIVQRLEVIEVEHQDRPAAADSGGQVLIERHPVRDAREAVGARVAGRLLRRGPDGAVLSGHDPAQQARLFEEVDERRRRRATDDVAGEADHPGDHQRPDDIRCAQDPGAAFQHGLPAPPPRHANPASHNAWVLVDHGTNTEVPIGISDKVGERGYGEWVDQRDRQDRALEGQQQRGEHERTVGPPARHSHRERPEGADEDLATPIVVTSGCTSPLAAPAANATTEVAPSTMRVGRAAMETQLARAR